MQRWLPLLMILVGLALAALYFGPGLYRNMLFKRDCQGFMTAVSTGDTNTLLNYIEQNQRNTLAQLISNVPPDYYRRIETLKLTSWQKTDPATIWAIVTLKLDNDTAGLGLYQGKLRWRYDDAGRSWTLDILDSYGAVYSTSGDPEWISLEDALGYAKALR
ncbi:hypothetical protein JW859_04535 [bacterium]|nr:hypothetical protein [bacterium]